MYSWETEKMLSSLWKTVLHLLLSKPYIRHMSDLVILFFALFPGEINTCSNDIWMSSRNCYAHPKLEMIWSSVADRLKSLI